MTIAPIIPMAVADYVTATNSDAVITYTAAGARVSHLICGLAWSYNGAPTAGSLKIENGSTNIVFSVDITNQGPGLFMFPIPLKGSNNAALIITLAAAGSGVVGKLSILGHITQEGAI